MDAAEAKYQMDGQGFHGRQLTVRDLSQLLLSYFLLLKDECVQDTFGQIGKRNGEVKRGEKHFGSVPKPVLRALFSDKSKCDAVENNMCETFNSWIVGPRHKSVISMLEDIRHKIMDRHGDMIKFASTWTSDISPIASQVAGNKRKQPTASRNSTATKNSATMGFGVYTDTQSGRQVINPGRASERVISSGSLKDASQTNVDLGFEPPCLKWKGKNAMTANQLQVMSQRKQLQIKSNYVP